MQLWQLCWKTFAKKPHTFSWNSKNDKRFSSFFRKVLFLKTVHRRPRIQSFQTWWKLFAQTENSLKFQEVRVNDSLFRASFFFRKYSIWHIEGSFDNASERLSAMFKKKSLKNQKVAINIPFFYSTCYLHVFLWSSGMQFWQPLWKSFVWIPQFFHSTCKADSKIIYFQEGTILLKMALRTCRMQGCKPDGKNPQGPKRSNSQKIKKIFFCKIS